MPVRLLKVRVQHPPGVRIRREEGKTLAWCLRLGSLEAEPERGFLFEWLMEGGLLEAGE